MRPQAQLADGWICVPYTGSDLQTVELALDNGPFHAAFLDHLEGQRVAKLRPHTLGATSTAGTLKLRVDGIITWQGTLTL
jgi:hypothetical protein